MSLRSFGFILFGACCIIIFVESFIPPPKSCDPNPCGSGSCHLVENRRARKKAKPPKAACQCDRGWTGLGCKWPCVDIYKSCQALWRDENRCRIHKQWTDWYDINCPVTCGVCNQDNRTISDKPPFPPQLEPIEFIVGTYQLDSTINNHFPVDFSNGDSYVETLQFERSEVPMFGTPCINYTARAVSKIYNDDMHVEQGFMTVVDQYNKYPVGISLMRVNSNGGVLWEEGLVMPDKTTFELHLKDVKTLTQKDDSVDMESAFPTEANRTLKVDFNYITIYTEEIKNGEIRKYTLTYTKVRDF